MGADAILASPSGSRMFEDARQSSVIRQKQQSFGINIEPPDAHQARKMRRVLPEKAENCRAAFWIPIRGHKAAWLVEQEQPRSLVWSEQIAVNSDFIAPFHADGRAPEWYVIELDASLGNPAFGLTTGTKARTRHNLSDAGAARLSSLVGKARDGGFRPLAFSILYFAHEHSIA